MNMKYYCPRCGTKDISEYQDTFECKQCRDDDGMPLEFDKKLIGKIPDKDIRSVREMVNFTGYFGELKDPEVRKKFYESLQDEDPEE